MKETNTQKNVNFEWHAWGARDIKRVFREAISAKRLAYAKIKKIPPHERTFENTIWAIESADYDHADLVNYAAFLMEVSPHKAIREAVKREYDIYSAQVIDVELDPDMYRAVKEYTAKKEKIKGADKKLLLTMVRDYKRMGFDLPKAQQKKYRTNLKKLTKLETSFQKNIADYTDFITLTEKEAEGLPVTYLQSRKKDAEGRYIVTLAYPDMLPFLKNSPNAKKRKELIDKKLHQGGLKNVKVFEQILALRVANAKLLGYKSHAEFRTEVRMARNPTNVKQFMSDLVRRLKSKLQKEFIELRDFKREFTGDNKAKLEYYDIVSAEWSYYINKLKQKKYTAHDELIKEYFPLEQVKRGMFEVYSRLFSISFKKVTSRIFWHEDVELYRVNDSKGKTIAHFYLDMYPREGKYGHAAVFPLVSGRALKFDQPQYMGPVVAMVTNFSKPMRENPSLLAHEEVETFFHEFGHVVHGVLTKARYASQSGTSTARDFVEAPSQMLEHWCWDKNILKILSGHYADTRKKLPADLLKSLLKAKNHMMAYWAIRQLVFAVFDFTIHDGPKHNGKAIGKIHDDIMKDFTGITMPPNIFTAGFGHLAGYDAGYYGYMWSKVYAVDMFTRFTREGLLNARTGGDYKHWILERGSTEDEINLVRGFLGRKPNSKAFLKEIGA